MSVDRVGTFLARATEWGVSVTTNGFPQFVAGHKPGTHNYTLGAESQGSDETSAVGKAAGGNNRNL